MKTRIVEVGKDTGNPEHYREAAEILQSGGTVAFPTETVYGLGADATDPEAVEAIYAAKGRPADNPLIVHVDSKEMALRYAKDVPADAIRCMDAFWPGPLTLVLQAKEGAFPENVTAGLPTVGLRMPDHPIARNLLKQTGRPIAAPSANLSGKPSPTAAGHVLHDLDGKIPLILDGGPSILGLESTVLDMTAVPPVILRPGSTTAEMLEEVIGKVRVSGEGKRNVPRSPGVKYTHYAPDAPVYLIEDKSKLVSLAIDHLHTKGKKVAVLSETPPEAADYSFPLSPDMLYTSLRMCDETDTDLILVAITEAHAKDAALMNRLEKAADHKWFS
ncbi:L-threonylcarbamoyladenylate synthase [Indiicoccus explosivorum]|uniref:L-threonylcarbamoyladenylate synthase n=1 Tax=Indiicoccus explosivorum TaxID=1917864 RepID=UPI000B454923|nr:L-threonylcarbamoyladenylate synthase [Indiicoccus explosivorum]